MLSIEARAAMIFERAWLIGSGKFAPSDAGSLYDIALRERVAAGLVDGAADDLARIGQALGEMEPVGMTADEARRWVHLMAEHASYALGLADLRRAPTIQHYRG